MSSLELVKTMYKEGWAWDYNPLIESFGEILLQVDDNDYHGDSRALLFKDGSYGILIFGWGSCSGCDSLQACSTHEEIAELRDGLESSTKWGSLNETLEYLLNHDWEGDYSWGQPETREFVEKAIEVLKNRG